MASRIRRQGSLVEKSGSTPKRMGFGVRKAKTGPSR